MKPGLLCPGMKTEGEVYDLMKKDRQDKVRSIERWRDGTRIHTEQVSEEGMRHMVKV